MQGYISDANHNTFVGNKTVKLEAIKSKLSVFSSLQRSIESCVFVPTWPFSTSFNLTKLVLELSLGLYLNVSLICGYLWICGSGFCYLISIYYTSFISLSFGFFKPVTFHLILTRICMMTLIVIRLI